LCLEHIRLSFQHWPLSSTSVTFQLLHRSQFNPHISSHPSSFITFVPHKSSHSLITIQHFHPSSAFYPSSALPSVTNTSHLPHFRNSVAPTELNGVHSSKAIMTCDNTGRHKQTGCMNDEMDAITIQLEEINTLLPSKRANSQPMSPQTRSLLYRTSGQNWKPD
jgi:hypothetical protein